MCSSDYHPSFPARFRRSETVKVKTFPLFKNLNKTPLFRRGHTATTARPFLTPQHAESHPLKTPLYFIYPCYALLTAIQFHLLNAFSLNTCATALILQAQWQCDLAVKMSRQIHKAISHKPHAQSTSLFSLDSHFSYITGLINSEFPVIKWLAWLNTSTLKRTGLWEDKI